MMHQSIMLFCSTGQITPLALLILVAGFNAIVFIQSGIDKLTDFRGNLEWMSEQFRNCFLRNSVGMSIRFITLLELLSGFGNVAGVIWLLVKHDARIVLAAYILTGITLLVLLFGQRVSKNYAGAVSLTGYFIIDLFGLMVLLALAI